jgi:hypothetical protein
MDVSSYVYIIFSPSMPVLVGAPLVEAIARAWGNSHDSHPTRCQRKQPSCAYTALCSPSGTSRSDGDSVLSDLEAIAFTTPSTTECLSQ